jgi:hypothetical protein
MYRWNEQSSVDLRDAIAMVTADGSVSRLPWVANDWLVRVVHEAMSKSVVQNPPPLFSTTWREWRPTLELEVWWIEVVSTLVHLVDRRAVVLMDPVV